MLTTAVIGYMKSPQGSNQTGFIIKQAGGSVTTYFADSASFSAGCTSCFGGFFVGGSDSGAFQLLVDCDPTNAGAARGGRLMYL